MVEELGSSIARCAILRGWLAYRKDFRALLTSVGITQGFQWVAGSFCEDTLKRPTKQAEPADIDIVTFVAVPNPPSPAQATLDIGPFLPGAAKPKYKCDAYVGTVTDGKSEVPWVTYWYGLFSHRREDYQWKGILRVDLFSDDAPALVRVGELEKDLSTLAALKAAP